MYLRSYMMQATQDFMRFYVGIYIFQDLVHSFENGAKSKTLFWDFPNFLSFAIWSKRVGNRRKARCENQGWTRISWFGRGSRNQDPEPGSCEQGNLID